MKSKNISLSILLSVLCVVTMAQTEGLVLNSKWTPDAGSYGQSGKLRLEAYTTGAQTTTTITQTKACDVVLVLDQSGSMSDNITSYTYTIQSSRGYSYNDLSSTYFYKDPSDGKYYEVERENDGGMGIL